MRKVFFFGTSIPHLKKENARISCQKQILFCSALACRLLLAALTEVPLFGALHRAAMASKYGSNILILHIAVLLVVDIPLLSVCQLDVRVFRFAGKWSETFGVDALASRLNTVRLSGSCVKHEIFVESHSILRKKVRQMLHDIRDAADRLRLVFGIEAI
jgi:hypothetical protein